MRGQASAAALKAAHPEPFDTRPDWLKDLDGDDRYDWARQAWASAEAEPGAWFDSALADAVVEDWPKWAILTVDRFAGVPFRLSKWQEIVVRMLVGWMIPVDILDPQTHAKATLHVRLFRRLMVWIPRKNGKSEFLAALALLFFVMDGVPQGEGYVFARKEDQARIVFNRMTAMVTHKAAPEEFRRDILAFGKSLYVKSLTAKFVVLSGSTEGLHGMSPTVIVGDEMHEWPTRIIEDTLRQGTGGRLQPIELYASTAGRKAGGHTAGEELYQESLDIVEGRRNDPTTLVVIFAANDNDDPGARTTHHKANPNLGLSPTEHFLTQEWAKAKGNPRKEAHFKCYHLGIWADEAVRWIPLPKWDACAATKDGWKKYPETLKGRKCFAAFDVSATTDITALALVFEPTDEDPKWRVIVRFWIPKDQVANRVAEGAPIDKFIAWGAMETTDGDYVDQNAVADAIQEARQLYDVQEIGYDSWNAAKLVTDMQAAPDYPVPSDMFVEIRQGVRSMGEPSKHFERLVFSGVFDHGGHPVLRWMAGNVVIHFDRNLNFMPAKDRSREKIDGIVACVMAVGLATRGEESMLSTGSDVFVAI